MTFQYNHETKSLTQKASMEKWVDVIGYNGVYQVSDMGNVKSVYSWGSLERKEKLLRQHLVNGYLTVSLYKDGIKKTFRSHRLVAIHFIPNPENLPEVNHKKGNKSDNRASELEWSTGLDNIRHGVYVLKCRKWRLYEAVNGDAVIKKSMPEMMTYLKLGQKTFYKMVRTGYRYKGWTIKKLNEKK